MAEQWRPSEFLRFQDKNNDGLQDVCGPQDIIEIEKCPACIIKPTALLPRWKNRSKLEPFLNERRCVYQITFKSQFTTTGAIEKYGGSATAEEAQSVLEERANLFKEECAEILIQHYNKEDSVENIKKVVESMEFTDWDLEPRPGSRLKFLFSVPFNSINDLEEAPEDAEDEEDIDTSDIVTTLIASKINSNMKRIRTTINFYASSLKVYRAIEGRNLIFVKGGVFNLERYGDFAPFGDSITERLVPALNDFLDRKGISLFLPHWFLSNNWATADKIEFTFTHDYRLKKMKVFTKSGCKPYVFRKKQLRSLNGNQAWKDRTAVAYFAKQREMIRDITARSPKPWVEFMIEHTYPQLKTIRTHNPIKISKISDEDDNRTIMGCIGDALEDEVKQLGQDIKDDIFSMADALAHQFNKKICLDDIKDLMSEDFKLGYIDDPGANPNMPLAEREKNIFQYAQEQAFKEIKEKDMLFAGLCARMASIFGGSPQNMLDKMWRQGWDPTMLCGLFDMLLDVIECLFKGLTFEELLASAIRSALKAMSIEDFGFLFIGLPADKRAKLDALVKEKLQSGDIFPEGSPGQRLSDSIENRNRDGSSTVPQNTPFFAKKIVIEHPWENEELVEEQNKNYMREGPLSGFSPSGIPPKGKGESQLTRATASQQFKNLGEGLNPDVIMEAYIAALIEEYSNNLTDLMKHLDNLPGAPIISYIIATLDCPIPPLFNPTIAEFLSDLALPFCKNKYHIGPPRIDNLFAWLPKISDILWFLYWLAMYLLQQIIIIIAMRLMIWLCELLSDFICNALGSLAAGIKALAQGGNFFDGVRDFICGPEATDEEVEETIQGMFRSFGNPEDAAALQDKEKVMSFVEDLSSAVSRKELTDAIAGEPSGAFFEVVDNLIEFEYPEFEGTFGNQAKTSAFFGNIGKLMPLEARDQLNQFREMLDDDDMMPANPSLCATPEDVEAFCEARAELLQGRAAPAQIDALCEAGRDSIKNDLQDIGDIFQKGIPAYFEENLPPLVSSDPTCDDGILPFEPPVIREATVNGMKSTFDPLEMAYVEDMLGDGNRRASQWGWLNMVLSDTMGNPYTRHQINAFTSGLFWFQKASYVDYYIPGTPEAGDSTPSQYAPVRDQQGAYPNTIALHLKNQIDRRAATVQYRSNNNVQDTRYFYQSYKNLGFMRGGNSIFGTYADIDVELTVLPDYGYNIKPVVEWSNQRVKFIKRARKAEPDLSLSFRDGGPFPDTVSSDNVYSYGFDVKMFTCDLVKKALPAAPPSPVKAKLVASGDIDVDTDLPDPGLSAPSPPTQAQSAFYNLENDATRMIIDKTINMNFTDFGDAAFSAGEADDESTVSSDNKYLDWQDMEFIAFDSTLENNSAIMSGKYPNFNIVMNSPATNVSPPLHLLTEMISEYDSAVISPAGFVPRHANTMSEIFSFIMTEVSNNEPAFKYGGQINALTKEQLEYGVEENGTFVEVSDYVRREVVAGFESGDMWNPNMMPMGMSRMEFDEQFNDGPRNRVHYLDPADYGGKKWNPPFYIEPAPPSGWLGMAQVIFPEYSPCDPKNVNLVNFEEIKDAVEQGYSKIPEDKRLQKDPDCVIEKPYNRILQRSGKAQIEGLVKTACKMFASLEMIKAYCVFGKFYPDFRNNFSNIFASYIVEIMEEELKDAQNDILEIFTPFKDDEFWYAFLEQTVQTYARLLETGDIREPAPHILKALEKLERFETNYDVPNKRDFKRAKRIGDTSRNETFKNYRYEKVLEGVQATEDTAKIILAEFVSIELDSLGKTWTENMEKQGMLDNTEMIRNIGYYVLQNLCSNTNLDLHKELKEEVVDAPTEDTSGLYTSGGEFIYRENTPYVGYYHAHKQEDGKIVFMEGEKHTDEAHEELFPLANKIIIPFGNIESISTTSGTKPFKAETYMKINGVDYSLEDGMNILRSNPNQTKNISEEYPGTMQLVISQTSPNIGKPVGVEGELGVRYGLRLKMREGGATIIKTEIDALDIPIGRIQPLEPNSKLLLCLINNLVDSPEFELLFKYIFPIPKVLSTVAMYSSLGFVASIGEIQTSINSSSVGDKPGNSIEEGLDPTGQISYAIVEGAPGWATKKQRYPGWFYGYGWRNLHFDRWSRQELNKSKAKLKKQFKIHYFGRKFDPGKTSIKDGGFGIHRMNRGNSAFLVSQYFKDNAALRLLPWHKIRMARRNPFNANKQKCKKV